jgi:hypothetical protein
MRINQQELIDAIEVVVYSMIDELRQAAAVAGDFTRSVSRSPPS